MATFPQSATYRDAKGQTSRVSFFVVNATAAGALTAATAAVNALTALTNAAFDGARGAYSSAPTTHTYGDDSPYPTIEDKAQLVFQTSTGAIHRYLVPAPLSGLFEEDDETVKTPDSGGDSEQVLLDTFVAAMVGDAASRDGVLLASYVGGIRVRRKFKRRFDIFTLNPQLTGPGE